MRNTRMSINKNAVFRKEYGQGFMSKIESKIQEKVMSFLFRGKNYLSP